jgi:hypothetical protein
MNKYIIEEKINFFEELNKSFIKNEIEDNLNDICLITNEILKENFITLKCGHKFNYIPLWNQIYQYKFINSIFKDINSKKIKSTIECPYCRNQENNLLPFYPNLNLKLAYGITSDNEKLKLILHNNKLVYESTIHCFNGMCCFVNNVDNENLVCLNKNVLLHEETNNTYCYKHINYIKSQFNKEKKLKIKQDLKDEKLKIKQQQKENQLKIKQDLKAEKLKVKQEQKENKLNKNYNNIRCKYILIKGSKKGQLCNCNAYENNFCKRHLLKSIN